MNKQSGNAQVVKYKTRLTFLGEKQMSDLIMMKPRAHNFHLAMIFLSAT
jgi:hypothetical protein